MANPVRTNGNSCREWLFAVDPVYSRARNNDDSIERRSRSRRALYKLRQRWVITTSECEGNSETLLGIKLSVFAVPTTESYNYKPETYRLAGNNVPRATYNV
jgi:hypothetical protein